MNGGRVAALITLHRTETRSPPPLLHPVGEAANSMLLALIAWLFSNSAWLVTVQGS